MLFYYERGAGFATLLYNRPLDNGSELQARKILPDEVQSRIYLFCDGIQDRSSKAAAPRLSRGVARPRPFNPRHLGGTGATSKEVVPAADAAPACVAALICPHHGLCVSQNCGTTPAVLPLSWETVQRLADFALGARFRRLPRFFRFKVQRSFATFDAGSAHIRLKTLLGAVFVVAAIGWPCFFFSRRSCSAAS